MIGSKILHGPPTNLNILRAVVNNKDVRSGYTTTNLMETLFIHKPYAIGFEEGDM
jgi:hypothetical protein